ncbi:hypothetical protein IFM89_024729 [Coptis chinensis]|uniref:Uncharacterized protein n=1 Tax=Coptis chinensis TaxID=261450 RepID=A0A835LGD2_9MAGN|nr:hypothetical protein IFM89_024729 [Coptis chinensis]
MDQKEEPASSSSSSSVPRPQLLKCFNALWFCYSPFHQMQQYYRAGVFDNCSGKWNALFDCLGLKTKPPSQAPPYYGHVLASVFMDVDVGQSLSLVLWIGVYLYLESLLSASCKWSTGAILMNDEYVVVAAWK